MMIELIESGPHVGDTWLREHADGWQYRIYKYKTWIGNPHYGAYRVDVLDEKGTTLLYTEEAHCISDDHACGWGEAIFCYVLMAHKRLPQPGVFSGPEDVIRYAEQMKKYRRE